MYWVSFVKLFFKNKLFREFLAFGGIQILNVLLPLVAFPFIVRILGIRGFGTFVLGQNIGMYFDLFVSFGFGLTAANSIAKLNFQQEKIAKSNVIITTKASLFLILTIVLLCLNSVFNSFGISNKLILIALIVPFGNIFVLDWYLQANQNAKFVLYITLFSKLLAFLALFIFLPIYKTPESALAFLGIGNILAGFFSISICYTKYNWKFHVTKINDIKLEVISNLWSFVSIISVPLYSTINYFILRYYHGELGLGIYAVPEKIFLAFGMMQSIINKPLIPYLSHVNKLNKAELYKKVIHISKFIVLGFSIISITVYIFSEFLIKIIVGINTKYITQQVQILKILCFIIVIGPLISFYQTVLIIIGKSKNIFATVLITIVINMIFVFYLTSTFNATGMAINYLTVNICLIIFSSYFLFRYLKLYRIK